MACIVEARRAERSEVRGRRSEVRTEDMKSPKVPPGFGVRRSSLLPIRICRLRPKDAKIPKGLELLNQGVFVSTQTRAPIRSKAIKITTIIKKIVPLLLFFSNPLLPSKLNGRLPSNSSNFTPWGMTRV